MKKMFQFISHHYSSIVSLNAAIVFVMSGKYFAAFGFLSAAVAWYFSDKFREWFLRDSKQLEDANERIKELKEKLREVVK